jgi:hypothetical protein
MRLWCEVTAQRQRPVSISHGRTRSVRHGPPGCEVCPHSPPWAWGCCNGVLVRSGGPGVRLLAWLFRVDLEAYRFEVVEVIGVAGEQGQVVRQRGRRDQQIERTRAAGLAVMGTRGGVDQTVDASSGSIERQRVQQCLDTLKPVLSPSTLLGVTPAARPSRRRRRRARRGTRRRRPGERSRTLRGEAHGSRTVDGRDGCGRLLVRPGCRHGPRLGPATGCRR